MANDDQGGVADIETAAEAANRKPTTDMDDDDLYRMFKQWFLADDEHCKPWLDQARKDFDLVAGDQWEETAAKGMTDANRVPLTFNLALKFLKHVCGQQVQSRLETVYLPRVVEPGDIIANETLSETSKWMGDNCDAEDEESEAFEDAATCGMGWSESRMDFEIGDPEGEFVEDQVDPLEMRWDRSARKKNLKDARRIWRVKTMGIDEAQAMFPDAEPGDLHASWAIGLDVGGENVKSVEERRLKLENSVPLDPKSEVNIVQIQWKERQCYYRVAHPDTGEEAEMSEADFKKLNKNLKRRKKGPKFEFAHAKQYRIVYRQAFLGSKVLAKGECPDPNRFTLQCITGQKHKNKGHWFGLAKVMRDPQMNFNKWMSQALHIMNTTAKGGVVAERGAFKNIREAQRTWASPDAITIVEDDAIQKKKIMAKPGVGLAGPYLQMMEFAERGISQSLGIPMEALAMADRNQPGILEAQRKQAGMTILATLFDSLRRFRKNKGRIRLHFIQNYMPDEKIIRIVGPDGAKAVKFIRDEHMGEYDVIVDDAPTSPNQKEATWHMLIQMSQLPMFQATLTPQIVVQLLTYCPLPSKIVQIMQKSVMSPNPMEQMMKQLGMKGQMAQIGKLEAEAKKVSADEQLAYAKSILTIADAGVRRMEAQQAGMQTAQMAATMQALMARNSISAFAGGGDPNGYAVAPMQGGNGALPSPEMLPPGMMDMEALAQQPPAV
jgi:hypothetical protein